MVTQIILLVLFLLLIFALLFGVRFTPKSINKDYLSYESTSTLKALCAVGIVLHHITNETDCGIFNIFRPVGYLLVALFFFFSGYGLMFSITNKPNYIKNFFKKRICHILIPYFIISIFYFVYKMAINNISLDIYNSILLPFLNAAPLIDNSWFVITILLVYFWFWFFYSVFSEKIAFIAFSITTLSITFTSIFINLGYWSPFIIIFYLGFIWFKLKDKIDKFIFSYNHVCFSVFLLMALCFIYLKSKTDGTVSVFASLTASFSFVILVLLISTRIMIENPLLSFISKVSYEIYLIHGFWILVMKSIPFIFNCAPLFLLLVIAPTILSAYLINLLNKKIFSIKLLN